MQKWRRRSAKKKETPLSRRNCSLTGGAHPSWQTGNPKPRLPSHNSERKFSYICIDFYLHMNFVWSLPKPFRVSKVGFLVGWLFCLFVLFFSLHLTGGNWSPVLWDSFKITEWISGMRTLSTVLFPAPQRMLSRLQYSGAEAIQMHFRNSEGRAAHSHFLDW